MSARLTKGKIVHLEEENALLRQRLFGHKSEQTTDPATAQLALFNEAESVAGPVDEACEEEVVLPTKRRGKRKPLPADLPRIEVTHELPEHELKCACGCRKHAIVEEVSEQLEIIPMQIYVIKHVRKVYGCRDCESAPVTADKPAQLIEKSMASPSVLAMLLTTKYVDGLPLHRFEKVLGRNGVDIPHQTLARWVIQCGEHFQPCAIACWLAASFTAMKHACRCSKSWIGSQAASPGCGCKPQARLTSW